MAASIGPVYILGESSISMFCLHTGIAEIDFSDVELPTCKALEQNWNAFSNDAISLGIKL